MHRNHLKNQLKSFQDMWSSDFDSFSGSNESRFVTVQRMQDFLKLSPDVFQRSYPTGHFTGSALLVDSGFEKVLLTHHAKLNLWLQLGGHADGESVLESVALREAQEESGLKNIQPLRYEKIFFPNFHGNYSVPFDIDIHLIPKHKNDPEHFHYDVRFIFMADPQEKIIATEESHEVEWFDLKKAYQITAEPSMWRQFKKVEFIRDQMR